MAEPTEIERMPSVVKGAQFVMMTQGAWGLWVGPCCSFSW